MRALWLVVLFACRSEPLPIAPYGSAPPVAIEVETEADSGCTVSLYSPLRAYCSQGRCPEFAARGVTCYLPTAGNPDARVRLDVNDSLGLGNQLTVDIGVEGWFHGESRVEDGAHIGMRSLYGFECDATSGIVVFLGEAEPRTWAFAFDGNCADGTRIAGELFWLEPE